jgi:hypothetical protein
MTSATFYRDQAVVCRCFILFRHQQQLFWFDFQRQKTPEAKPIKSSKFYKEREEPAIVLLYFGVTPRPSRLHSFLSNF